MTLLSTTVYDAAIIGAGIAGSYCAASLQQKGLNVCLLEKSRGTGGRASSRRLATQSKDDAQQTKDEAQQSCELGTPFFHHQYAELDADIRAWLAAGVIALWPAADKQQQAAYTGIPAMSALTRYLSQSADFYAGQRIAHIDRIDQRWHLRDERYQTLLTAKRLIITAPAAQSCELLTSPDAPDSYLLAAHAASRRCLAQWVAVLSVADSELSARLAALPEVLDFDHPVLARMICDSAKPGRIAEPVRWVLQANPQWSEMNKDLDSELLGKKLLQAMVPILAKHLADDSGRQLGANDIEQALSLSNIHRWRLGRHDWFVDLASVDNASVDNASVDRIETEPALWDAELNLGLAADWLNGGTIAGAMQSAKRLASMIIA